MTGLLTTLVRQAQQDADPDAPRGAGAPRLVCGCGFPIEHTHEPGSSWGDWRCERCGAAWCPDCGAPVDLTDGQCTAYTAQQEEWAAIERENAEAQPLP